jgi:hypothetical protein
MNERAAQNTDRELWRELHGDYYANSIHVTEGGGIGINVGGKVFVKPLAEWHKLAAAAESARAERGGTLPVTPQDYTVSIGWLERLRDHVDKPDLYAARGMLFHAIQICKGERAPERRLTREQVLTAIKRGGYSYDKQTDEIMKLIEGTK